VPTTSTAVVEIGRPVLAPGIAALHRGVSHAFTHAPFWQIVEPVHAIVSGPTSPAEVQLWTLPSCHTLLPGEHCTQPSISLHATAQSSCVAHMPLVQTSYVLPKQRWLPSLHAGSGASIGGASSPLLARRGPTRDERAESCGGHQNEKRIGSP